MVEIEQALHKLHAREKAKREQDETDAQGEAMEQRVTLPPPFARVDAVTQGSPACGAVSDVNYLAILSYKLLVFSKVELYNFCPCDDANWLFLSKGAQNW